MTSKSESESKIKIKRKHVAAGKVVCCQFNGGGVGYPPHPGSGIP